MSAAGPLPAASAGGAPRRGETLRLLLRNPLAVVGGSILLVVVLVALFDQWIAPQGVNVVDITARLQPPGPDHWFGTDELGRDVFSRVVLGARTSLQVGLVAVGIALVAGVIIGLLAGYFGRWIDPVLMRAMDVLFAFPAILMAIAVLAILGPGTVNTMVAIGIVYTPIFARVTRAGVLSVSQEVYVRASRSVGVGDLRMLLVHVLPNAAPPIIVQTTVSLAFAILTEAALSFVGLGVQPPDPSWGRMLIEGRGFLQQAWWMAVFPGAAIFVTVLAFNILGDALRDVLDPKQRTLAASR